MKKLLGILTVLAFLSTMAFAGASFDGKVDVWTSGGVFTNGDITIGNSAGLLGNMEAFFDVGGATDDGIAEGLFKVKLFKTSALTGVSSTTTNIGGVDVLYGVNSSTGDVIGVSLEDYWANVILVEDVLKLTFYKNDGWGLKTAKAIADLINLELLFTGSFEPRFLLKASKTIPINDGTKFVLDEARIVDVTLKFAGNLNDTNMNTIYNAGLKWKFETSSDTFFFGIMNNNWINNIVNVKGNTNNQYEAFWLGARFSAKVQVKANPVTIEAVLGDYSFDNGFVILYWAKPSSPNTNVSFDYQGAYFKVTANLDKTTVWASLNLAGSGFWDKQLDYIFATNNINLKAEVGLAYKPTSVVEIKPVITIPLTTAAGAGAKILDYKLTFTYDPAAFVFAKKE